jgi:hypothetical protein
MEWWYGPGNVQGNPVGKKAAARKSCRESSGKEILPGRNQRQKAKLLSLSNQNFLLSRLSSLNDFELCMENLHAMEPNHD